MPTVKFLGGSIGDSDATEVFVGKKQQILSTTGQNVTQINTVMLRDQITDEEITEMAKKPD